VAFTKIDERFKKSDSIAITNGQHMSHIRKDLTLTHSKVENLDFKVDNLVDVVTKHITSISPILENYNDTQATKRTFKKYVFPIVAFVMSMSGLLGAILFIISVFKK
jgi:hypothetical protein